MVGLASLRTGRQTARVSAICREVGVFSVFEEVFGEDIEAVVDSRIMPVTVDDFLFEEEGILTIFDGFVSLVAPFFFHVFSMDTRTCP